MAMNPRDIAKPTVQGFPGLPAWLDGPLVKNLAKKWGITQNQVRAKLMEEAKVVKPRRNVPVNRGPLPRA